MNIWERCSRWKEQPIQRPGMGSSPGRVSERQSSRDLTRRGKGGQGLIPQGLVSNYTGYSLDSE